MKDYQKRAQQNYIKRKVDSGWRWVKAFVPMEIKEKVMNYKNQLMKEYYDSRNNK